MCSGLMCVYNVSTFAVVITHTHTHKTHPSMGLTDTGAQQQRDDGCRCVTEDLCGLLIIGDVNQNCGKSIYG